MKLILFLIAAGLVASTAYLAEDPLDPFFLAGGSDSAEQIIALPRTIRLVATVLVIASLGLLTFRPSLVAAVLMAVGLGVFVLAHNTVRISGKSYEVVQSFALIPVTRFSVVEGQGDLANEIFIGLGPLSLPQKKLRTALEGLKRK